MVTVIKFDVWAKILLAVDRDLSISDISRKIDVSYSHVHELVFLLRNRKLLALEKHGRLWIVSLTPKGLKIMEHLKEVNIFMGWS